MDDYSRIATVIRYLETHQEHQPSLSDLAGVVGLSESHFHRLFRSWAGVTPKDFLQCLTVEHARRVLRESKSVLDASIDAGLSGPGRLHDLFVSLEAATPGEVKGEGEGLDIAWGNIRTPFGPATIGWTNRGVCHLSFAEDGAFSHPPEDLVSAWRRASFNEDERGAGKLAARIFSESAVPGEKLSAYVKGTPFQVKVWRALLRIPEGQLVSYGALAEAVGLGGASRAVGGACGANAIAYLIPCHRVIRETGVVTGYRWGDTRKRAILARETSAGTTTLQGT